MDIYEEFDEEDIKDIEEIIVQEIEEGEIKSICYKIVDIIAKISAENANNQYRDDEDDEEYEIEESDEEQNSLIEKIEDSEIPLDIALKIILNDDKIINNIADGISEIVNLSDDYVALKKHNIDILSGIAMLLHTTSEHTEFNQAEEYIENPEQLNSLKDVLKNKIMEMNYTDFIILMNEYQGTEIIVGDSFFSDSVIEKIDNMSNEQFAYYLKRISLRNNICTEIQKTEEQKAKSANSTYIEYVYNMSRKIGNHCFIIKDRHDAFTLDTMEWYKYDSVNRIIENMKNRKKEQSNATDSDVDYYDITTDEISKDSEYKMYCELLKQLNKKEFVCFMLRNGNDNFYDTEKEIIEQKLSEISREDLIVLTKRLCCVELELAELTEEENESVLLKVAKSKGIVNESNELVCTKEEIKEAGKKLITYSYYTNNMEIPTLEIEDNESVEEFDVDMLPYEEKKKYEYLKAEKEINDMVAKHKEMDEISKLSNKDIIAIINNFNSIISNEDANNKYRSMARFLEFKMLSMPAIYANAFNLTGKGCLADTMELKIDELREEFENFKMNFGNGSGTDVGNSGSNGISTGKKGISIKDISNAIDKKRRGDNSLGLGK